MSYTKSKQFIQSKSSEDSFQGSARNDFERDDDDPLSIKSLSITILGFLIALLTILLPLIGVLLGKPLSQGNEMFFNYSIKKDGS